MSDKVITNDSSDIIPAEFDLQKPLKNSKWEKFCEIVTGWGGTGEPTTCCDAYMQAYKCKSNASARANSARLISSHPEVRERISWMKSQLAESALIDKASVRRRLFKDRMEIIEKTKNPCHKDVALAAMRDLEKSLGLDAPEFERTAEVEEKTDAADGLGVVREALKKVTTKIRE